MTGQAVDSFGIHTRASAQALAANGITAALRYHYNTSRLEVDTLHAAGVGFGLIAEFDTRTWHPPIDNPETGGDQARKAVQVAQALGMPKGCAIWFTQDTDLRTDQYERALTYWDNGDDIVRAAGYRVGAYGEASFIDLLIDRGKADLAWQAGADGWAQGGRSKHACLWQRVGQPVYSGVTCDPNLILRDDCGFWMPDGAQTPSGAPAPTTPTPEEIDVPTIIRIKTKAGEYLYDPCAGTARNISGDESTVLQAAPFSLPKYEFDAGSAMHRILNGDGTTITKLGYTEVG